MIFFDLSDRIAGIAAMVELYNHMANKPDVNPVAKMESAEARTQHCTEAWDNAGESEREAFLLIWQGAGLAPDSYYEAHMTFQSGQGFNAIQLSEIGEKFMWHFSAIDGDEFEGAGRRWYLTRSLKDGQTLFNDMKALCYVLDEAKIPYIRRKIEHIVFDERKDQIAGTARAA